MRKIHIMPLIAIPLLGAALLMAGDSTHPLANAKSGQWVLLMETKGADDTAQRDDAPKGIAPKKGETSKVEAAKERFFYKWIDMVAKRSVSIRTQTVTKDGKLGLGEPWEIVVNLDAPAEDHVAPAAAEEEILFKDKKLTCKKFESVRTDPKLGKVTTTRWVSDEVPIYGVVRSITVDEDKKELLRIDLLDFGSSGGSARPMDKKD